MTRILAALLGEHQKPWGSFRSVWVREIRVTDVGTEGIWDRATEASRPAGRLPPGKEAASLPPPPLRTVREDCSSYGSRKPVTELPCGPLRVSGMPHGAFGAEWTRHAKQGYHRSIRSLTSPGSPAAPVRAPLRRLRPGVKEPSPSLCRPAPRRSASVAARRRPQDGDRHRAVQRQALHLAVKGYPIAIEQFWSLRKPSARSPQGS